MPLNLLRGKVSFKKTSVIQIKNDDNNCFWYALAVTLNKDNNDMKNNARPKKRNMLGEQLCHKAKLTWDEPVSFVYIPLVEEALNINIYVIDLDNLPVLGAAINLWDCLTYKSMDRGTERHWLLMDGNHYHVIN